MWLAAGLLSVAACDGGGGGDSDASQPQDASPLDARGIDAACFAECQEGAAECWNGRSGRSCADADGDGCLEWQPFADCPPDQACLESVGCVPGFAVQYQGTGPGRTVQSVGTPCTGCVRGYAPGTVIEVTAVADQAAHFVGWSGGTCTGTGPCTVSAAATVSATFAYDCTATTIDAPASDGAIALDGPYVYWTSFSDDVVKRAPRSGGAVEPLASSFHPVGLALDSTYAYWVSGTLLRYPKAGGSAEPVPLPFPPPMADGSVVVDATHLYWIGGSAIFRWPIAGGPATVVATGAFSVFEPRGQALALDADYLYWADRDAGIIARVAKAGGSVEPIATGQVGALAIVLAGDDIYWTNYAAGTVSRAPKTGGQPVVIATGENHPSALATEGGHVYWITNSGAAYVSRVALAGTSVERVLFAPGGGGMALAVDANAIYFSGRTGLTGMVARAPRGGTCAPAN